MTLYFGCNCKITKLPLYIINPSLAMHIGICSDSHDHVTNAENAANYFRQEETGLVIHAGDYCSPFIIGCFENLPLHGIFGNNDGYRTTIAKKFEQIGARSEEHTSELQSRGHLVCRILPEKKKNT